jgi:hypothetical protein
MITKELACEKISGLVTRFDEQYDSYKRSDYNKPRPGVIFSGEKAIVRIKFFRRSEFTN